MMQMFSLAHCAANLCLAEGDQRPRRSTGHRPVLVCGVPQRDEMQRLGCMDARGCARLCDTVPCHER